MGLLMALLHAVVRGQEHLEERKLEVKTVIVRNLLSKYDFTDVQICDMAEVTLDFVKEVRANLGKE